MSKQMVDTVPSENDVEYMFDTFADKVEEYIKPDKIEKFNEQLNYLQRDIVEEFDGVYAVMEAIDVFVDEIGV